MITTRLLFIAHFPSDRQVRGFKIALPMKSRGTWFSRFLQLFVILGFLCSLQHSASLTLKGAGQGTVKVYCCLAGVPIHIFRLFLWDRMTSPSLPGTMGSLQSIFFSKSQDPTECSLSPFHIPTSCSLRSHVAKALSPGLGRWARRSCHFCQFWASLTGQISAWLGLAACSTLPFRQSI